MDRSTRRTTYVTPSSTRGHEALQPAKLRLPARLPIGSPLERLQTSRLLRRANALLRLPGRRRRVRHDCARQLANLADNFLGVPQRQLMTSGAVLSRAPGSGSGRFAAGILSSGYLSGLAIGHARERDRQAAHGVPVLVRARDLVEYPLGEFDCARGRLAVGHWVYHRLGEHAFAYLIDGKRS